jgi:tetratricopeptide (TPR) repeat protein
MKTSFNKASRVILLTAVASLSALAASAPSQADATAAYEPGFLRQAERALRRGSPERALLIVEAHSTKQLRNRHRAEAEGINCRAYLAMGAPEEARSACASAITLDPSRGNWRFLNNLGVAEVHLGNLSEAEDAFRAAATRSGYSYEPRRNLLALEAQRREDVSTTQRRIASGLR